jgi:lipopolysaccharide/colanic/teichoic acid biosynthesis glycosyltransferase
MPPKLHDPPLDPAPGVGSIDALRISDSRPTAENLDLSAATRYEPLKRALDLAAASLLMLAAAPIILACAALIRITSRGPAFYSQTRLGRLGRPFRIHKLRTMTHNCEKTSGARWATRNDPRITSIGKVLRLTHLDELPQLWNVLRGDMSLVGPRPERPEFIPMLEKTIQHYRQRMLVRPGVTGLAQVYLPPDTGIPSVRKKLHYDLYYMRTMGPLLDLRLIAATALQAFGVPCRFVRRFLFLPQVRSLEQPPRPHLLGDPTAPVAALTGPIVDLPFESQSEATA